MTRPRSIYGCDEALPEHLDGRRHLGQKAMGLRWLWEQGYSVPAFFTISTEVCAAYHASSRRLPRGVLDEVMEQASGLITGESTGPPRVAVRSGAPESMPGALETVLGVPMTEPALESAIGAVLDSWSGPPAVAYRRAFQLDQAVGTGVTVQALVETECAGVLFSAVDTEDGPAELRIEYVPGSGKQVVDGSRNPIEIRVPRSEQELTNWPPVSGPIEPNQIRQLCTVALEIESKLGYPVDLEWGYSDGQLYLFQVRRISTQGGSDGEATTREEELLRIRRLEQEGPWLRHALHESVPTPTPLTWSVLEQLMSGSGGFGNLYRMLGFEPSQRVRQQGFLALMGGRIYANPGRQAELFAPWPLQYDVTAMISDDAGLDVGPSMIDVDKIDSLFLFRIPWLAWKAISSRRRIVRMTRSAASDFDQFVQGEYANRLQQYQAEFEQGENQVRMETLHRLCEFVLHQAAPRLLLPGLLGGHAWNRLRTKLQQWLGEDTGDRVSRELICDIPLDHSPLVALVREQSAGEDDAALLQEYGHRCFEEMELSAPRWRETPDRFQELVNDWHSTNTAQPAGNTHVPPAQERLEQALAEAGVHSLASRVTNTLREARQLLVYREHGRHFLMQGFAAIRQCVEAIARQTELGAAIYFLELSELEVGLDGDRVRSKIEQRRKRWQALQELRLPVVLGAPIADGETGSRERTMGRSLSLGIERGTVHDLESAEDGPSEGSILLCSSLSPTLLAHLPGAKAIIAEQGGYLSHVALVARALGKPVIIVRDACDQYRCGEDVTVNADLGEVYRHTSDSEASVT